MAGRVVAPKIGGGRLSPLWLWTRSTITAPFAAKKRSSIKMKNKMIFWQTTPLETSRNPKFRGHVRLSPLSYPTCHTAFNPPCTGYCWCRHNEYETHCGILANNRPGNFPQIQNFGAISAPRPHHTLCLIPLLILQVTGEP